MYFFLHSYAAITVAIALIGTRGGGGLSRDKGADPVP